MLLKDRLGSTNLLIARLMALFFAFGMQSVIGASSVAGMPLQSTELIAEIQKAQALLAKQEFSSAEKVLRPLSEKFPDKPGPIYLLGNALLGQKRFDEALVLFEKGKSYPQVRANCLYNIACIRSIQKKPDEAFAALEEAIKAGFVNFAQMQTDSDLVNIQNDVRFKKLLPKLLADNELFI
jgi:tetratricopeptide (TPR) repeat protein